MRKQIREHKAPSSFVLYIYNHDIKNKARTNLIRLNLNELIFIIPKNTNNMLPQNITALLFFYLHSRTDQNQTFEVKLTDYNRFASNASQFSIWNCHAACGQSTLIQQIFASEITLLILCPHTIFKVFKQLQPIVAKGRHPIITLKIYQNAFT